MFKEGLLLSQVVGSNLVERTFSFSFLFIFFSQAGVERTSISHQLKL